MSAVFVINPGGSSRKYALYVSGRPVLESVFEKNGDSYVLMGRVDSRQWETKVIHKEDFRNSLREFSSSVKSFLEREKYSLDVIGVRFLAAGTKMQRHHKVDEVFLSELRAKEATAPLHIPTILSEIQESKALFPGVTIVAVSDTELFAALPPESRLYSLPPADAKTYDVYRFGYHGISASSVLGRVHAVLGQDPERIVICHLGSGTSVSGFVGGKPVHTSSGYAPFTGLPMPSRGGDIDAAVVLELLRLNHGKLQETNEYLHHKTGLLGLAHTSDLRAVLDQRARGEEQAALAIKVMVLALQKSIAAAAVSTSGIDALVFTGTIGSRSAEFRQLVTEGLSHLGLGLNVDKNNMFLGREGVISHSHSSAKIVVVKTDEMGEIATIALRQLEKLKKEGDRI